MLTGIVVSAALLLAAVALLCAGHLHNRMVALEERMDKLTARMDAHGRASLDQSAGVKRVERVADEMLRQVQALAKREGPTRLA